MSGNTAVTRQSKILIELRAGKMFVRGERLLPDNRRGFLFIIQHYSSSNARIHFCWKERSSGAVEYDILINPGDCEFKLVPYSTTGRVYELFVKSSNKKSFFWLQEPRTNHDREYCRRINVIMNLAMPAPAPAPAPVPVPVPVYSEIDAMICGKKLFDFVSGLSASELLKLYKEKVLVFLQQDALSDTDSAWLNVDILLNEIIRRMEIDDSDFISSMNNHCKETLLLLWKKYHSVFNDFEFTSAMNLLKKQWEDAKFEAMSKLAQDSQESEGASCSNPSSEKDKINQAVKFLNVLEMGKLESVVQKDDLKEATVNSENQVNMEELTTDIQQINIGQQQRKQ